MRKRIISLLLAAAMMISILPLNAVKAAAGDPEVTISYMYDRFGSQPKQTIFTINDNSTEIRDWTIDKVSIWYVGGTHEEVTVSRYGPRISGAVTNGAAIESIIIVDSNNNANYVTYTIPSGKEVKVESAAESEFQPQGPITLIGENIRANASDLNTTIIVGTVEAKVKALEDGETPDSREVKIVPKDETPFGTGAELQNIVFKTIKEDQPGRTGNNAGDIINYTLNINSTYEKVLKVVGDLNLKDVEMFPNSGQKGDIVTFKSQSIAEAYDVYFVKSVTDQQEYDKHPIAVPIGDPAREDPNNPLSKYTYSVKIPDLGDASGEYYIVFTNRNSIVEGISQKYVLEDQSISPEYVKFTYVTAGNPTVIDDFDPKSAPEQTPTLVTIKGFNIGKFALDNSLFSKDTDTINDEKTKITVTYPEQDNFKIGSINYGTVTIQREITVSIGGDATIESVNFPDDGQETIVVKTQKYTLTQPENLVTIKMVTTITPTDPDKGSALVFYKEVYSKEPFVFIPTTEKPEVTSVVPEVVPIEPAPGESGYYLISRNIGQSNELEVNIYGKNFLVTKKDNNLIYPRIGLGEIIVDPNDKLDKPEDTDPDKLNKFTFGADNLNKIITFEVLDAKGALINGDINREIGTHIRIILKLSDDQAEREKIGSVGKQPIIIHNPWRGSDSEFSSYSFAEKIEFKDISAGEFPSIANIQPSVVSTKGGDSITITGTNFKPGAEVYIDGVKVAGAKVDNSGERDKITFNAPARREGMAKVIVVNPAKAFAVGNLYYTITYTDPSFTSINPNKGTQDDTIIIQGQNFKLKDATVDASQYKTLSEMLMYRLMGTRVFINNQDINDYYRGEDGEIGLQKFEDGAENAQLGQLRLKENIFSAPISASGTGVIQLAKDFRSVILLKEDITNSKNNKFYKIKEEMDGTFKITDDRNEEFKIYVNKDQQIKAKKGTVDYDVIQLEDKKGSITLQSTSETIQLQAYTPYAIARIKDDDGNDYDRIVGNRVFLMTTSQIFFSVPPKTKIGQGKYDAATGAEVYDVKIMNPDAKSVEKKESFYYISPAGVRPKVISFNPEEGSADGGNMVTFSAPAVSDPEEPTGFVDNSTGKTRVIIGTQEVSKDKVQISTNGREISVVIPACDKDFKVLNVDRIIEPIVLINPNGVTFQINMNAPLNGVSGYTYVLVNNKPNITEVREEKGNVVGEEKVYIFGSGFRYFEPFQDTINVNGKWDDGEPYTELNGDGKWTSLGLGGNVADLTVNDNRDDRKILPTIYFGNKKAELLSFSEGVLIVKAPIGTAQTVSVYVVNNDYGVSNTLSYTYEASKPAITAITPSSGTRYGNAQVYIEGTYFKNSKIRVYDSSSTALPLADTELMTVRFGDMKDEKMSNLHITDIKHRNYGGIINGKTVVETGTLTVDYDAAGSSPKLQFALEEQGKTYTTEQSFEYNDKMVFLPLTELAYKETAASTPKEYTKNELVKVELITEGGINRLIVERGYASAASANIQEDQIILRTPAYYTIGKVPVTIINPDGGQAEAEFDYTSPSSRPVITNITKAGTVGSSQQVNGKDAIVIRMSYKGGNRVTISGLDFRENATIFVGTNIAKIPASAQDREDILPTQIKFTMPAVNEGAIENADGTPKYHPVIIQNEDGAAVSSETISPLPIYIQFVKGETFPEVEKVTPGYGPAIGGISVKIEGKNFRKTMPEDYGEKKLAVYFGDIKVPEDDIDWEQTNEYTIVVKAIPSHTPGAITVRVENPDLSLSAPWGEFIYTSNPKIVVVENANGTEVKNISALGDQEIYIQGSGFMEGARVIFNPKQPLDEISQEQDAKGQPIYINGVLYDLQDGAEGTDVKVENGGQTIIVKTPAMALDGRGIIVINPDQGASEVYDGVVYSIPEIEAPPGKVYAELVYDRYIKVNWSAVEGAKEYEIYVVINRRETELIGSTKLTSYLYEDLEPRTEYKFIIKAVGEFNISKPSMESNEVKTGRKVGPPDTDGGLNENTKMEKSGDQANIIIGEDSYDKSLTIDLTKGTLAGSKEIVVSMSAKVVSGYKAKDIKIIGKDFMIQFNPNAFNISRVEENKKKDDAGVRFRIAPFSGSPSTEGGKTLLSAQYTLEANAYVGADSTEIDYLKSDIEISLDFDSAKADMRRLNSISLNRYDLSAQNWVPAAYRQDEYSISIRGLVNRIGRYSVIGSR